MVKKCLSIVAIFLGIILSIGLVLGLFALVTGRTVISNDADYRFDGGHLQFHVEPYILLFDSRICRLPSFDYRTPLMEYLHEKYGSSLTQNAPESELSGVCNYHSRVRCFFRREDLIQWSEENPEKANIFWPLYLQYLNELQNVDSQAIPTSSFSWDCINQLTYAKLTDQEFAQCLHTFIRMGLQNFAANACNFEQQKTIPPKTQAIDKKLVDPSLVISEADAYALIGSRNTQTTMNGDSKDQSLQKENP